MAGGKSLRGENNKQMGARGAQGSRRSWNCNTETKQEKGGKMKLRKEQSKKMGRSSRENSSNK